MLLHIHLAYNLWKWIMFAFNFQLPCTAPKLMSNDRTSGHTYMHTIATIWRWRWQWCCWQRASSMLVAQTDITEIREIWQNTRLAHYVIEYYVGFMCTKIQNWSNTYVSMICTATRGNCMSTWKSRVLNCGSGFSKIMLYEKKKLNLND